MSNYFGDIFSSVETEKNEYLPVPKGKYLARIKKSEVKQTKAGTGFYLNLMLEIVSEDHKGRVLFDILNLKNPNETAEQIGKSRLKLLLGLAGVDEKDMAKTEVEFLIGKVYQIAVGIDKNDESRNKIYAYLDFHKDLSVDPEAIKEETEAAPSWM